MKKTSLMLFVVLLGAVLFAESTPRQLIAQPDLPTGKLVAALRILNTAEYSYRGENGRFADREALLAFLQKKSALSSKSPVDLESPKPYELAITTTSDGTHYQITLQRLPDMNDKGTRCTTAAFSDEKGVIFLGQAIGCEAAPR